MILNWKWKNRGRVVGTNQAVSAGRRGCEQCLPAESCNHAGQRAGIARCPRQGGMVTQQLVQHRRHLSLHRRVAQQLQQYWQHNVLHILHACSA